VNIYNNILFQLPNRGPNAKWPIQYGFMQDNKFLFYDRDKLPIDAASWERTVFVDKTHWGFYTWPK
jgi:hypothetical protein